MTLWCFNNPAVVVGGSSRGQQQSGSLRFSADLLWDVLEYEQEKQNSLKCSDNPVCRTFKGAVSQFYR